MDDPFDAVEAQFAAAKEAPPPPVLSPYRQVEIDFHKATRSPTPAAQAEAASPDDPETVEQDFTRAGTENPEQSIQSRFWASVPVPGRTTPPLQRPEPLPTPEPSADMTFWNALKQGTLRGMREGVLSTATGIQAATEGRLEGLTQVEKPHLQGPTPSGHTLDQIADPIGHLMEQPLSEGWSDPKWWGANIAHGFASSTPALAGGLATGALGSALGGPVGGAIGAGVGFGTMSAVQAIVPAYQRAKAEGLSDEEAVDRAIVDTGIAATFGTVMGVAPGLSIFGKNSTTLADGQIVKTLRRPIMEAMTQLGLIQPALGGAQTAATLLAEGKDVGIDPIATSMALNLGMGMSAFAAHAPTLARKPKAGTMPTGEDVRGAYESLPGRKLPTPEALDREFADVPGFNLEPNAAAAMSRVAPPESGPLWFSQVQRTVQEAKQGRATPGQWLGLLRNAPGVRGEELEFLGLPQWLADREGKVSKDELLTHLEERALQVEETVRLNPQAERARLRRAADAIGVRIRAEQDPVVFDQLRREYYRLTEQADALENRTKYEDQTITGPRDEYVELALRMPTTEHEKARSDLYRLDDTTRIGERVEERRALQQRVQDTAPFDSPHEFPRNTVAHLRATGRVDNEGRRVLVLEEVQSDWHQQGQQTGYRGKAPTKGVTQSWNNLQDEGRVQAVRREGGVEIELDGRPLSREQSASMAWDRAFELYSRQIFPREQPVPQAPFRSSWPELTIKRFLRWAADNGYERVAVAPTEEIVRRAFVDGTNPNAKRLREFYDRDVKKALDKWAKKLGMDETEVKVPTRQAVPKDPLEQVPFDPHSAVGGGPDEHVLRGLNLDPRVASNVREGLPLFSKIEEGHAVVQGAQIDPKAAAQVAAMRPVVRVAFRVIENLAKQMGFKKPIKIQMIHRPNEPIAGTAGVGKDGSWVIKVNMPRNETATKVWATLAHEFGHIVFWEKRSSITPELEAQIDAAYKKFRASVPADARLQKLLGLRDNGLALNEKLHGDSDVPVLSLTPEAQKYWMGREEWEAEQVAKWATTDSKPLSAVDRFFASLGRLIRKTMDAFSKKMGQNFEAEPAIAKWLNSFMTDSQSLAADIAAQAQREGMQRAQAAMRRNGTPQAPVVPPMPSSAGGRAAANAVGAGHAGQIAATHADRINWLYDTFLGLTQVADRNPHIRGLQYFRDLMDMFHMEMVNGAAENLATVKAWRRLGTAGAERLGAFLDDWMNMRYRTQKEIDDGVRRMPTPAEFAKMVADRGLGAQELAVFKQITTDFTRFVDRIAEQLRFRARRIADPAQQALALEAIDKRIQQMKQAPYFPAKRFGNYTVTIYDANNRAKWFAAAESKREQRRLHEQAKKLADTAAGDTVLPGYMAKDVMPLRGLPPVLLDLVEKHLNLSTTQKNALEQLRLEAAPEASFGKQLLRKDYTPGYSSDFIRSYASYFFHGNRYLNRVKYKDSLLARIKEVRRERYTRQDATKLDQIANFMTDAMDAAMNPRADFAVLRGLAFHWYLGFNPASAALNLAQTLVGTYPMLAAAYGDHRAAFHMLNEGRKLSTYYKKGTILNATDRKLQMYGEGIRLGRITEAMAPELAGIAEGRNLGKGFGGNAAERVWQKFGEASTYMFEHTEQLNRRVAYRAGLELALRHPDSKFVNAAVRAHPGMFEELRARGWTEREAAAIVAANRTVDATQFQYAQWTRPKFMRGRAGAVFMFKTFVQNTLFMLWNYPAAAARSMIIMGALGGLMGLPGMEDLFGLLKGLAWQLFGKDFDLADEVRKFVVDHLRGGGDIAHPGDFFTSSEQGPMPSGKTIDEETGRGGGIRADIILHGVSRVGYGLPQMMDLLGHQFGLSHIAAPTFDRHQAIGMGNILPIEPGKLFGPQATQSPAGAISMESQKAAGAIFGLGYSFYRFLTDSQLQLNDAKRWETIMPRAMSNASKAFRMYNEGMERNRKGNAVVTFDPWEPEHMFEVLGRAAGYQPARLQAQWDRIMAEQEQITMWDLRRQGLLRQLWAARNDPENYDRVMGAIKQFNETFPEELQDKEVRRTKSGKIMPPSDKRITKEVIEKSFSARSAAAGAQESGTPRQRANVPIARSVQRLYPEGLPRGMVGSKRVEPAPETPED